MDWKTCIIEGNSFKINPDKRRAEFLLKNSERTIKVMKKIKIDDENCSVFFANYYDALLEILHALMYSKGFKVKNHYCLGYYIRDVMHDTNSFRVFDRARSVRNSVIYYGENLGKDVYSGIIEQIIMLFYKIKNLV